MNPEDMECQCQNSEGFWEGQYPGEVIKEEETAEVNLKEILRALLNNFNFFLSDG